LLIRAVGIVKKALRRENKAFVIWISWQSPSPQQQGFSFCFASLQNMFHNICFGNHTVRVDSYSVEYCIANISIQEGPFADEWQYGWTCNTFKDEIKVIIDLSHCWEKHCETSLAGCFYWVFLNIRRLNKSSECWKHGNYINELLFVAFAWVAFRANRFILHFHTSRSLNWLHKSGGHTAILFSIIDDTRVRISSYYNFG
jgi:hypothetical protein